MMKALYREKGAEMRIEILNEKEVEDFIGEHADILDSTFAGTKMSDTMRRSLQESDYVFSGMKTFHELNEAFPSLLDDKGERKPFERFLNDVQRIDSTYNRNYLRSEYNFVEASSTMAGKWEQFEADGDDYYLQYRTAGDSKVRPEHAALDRVTLP
ncbi:MAG: phage head morphogenesis protein, partial [Bacteroidales bacterium]